MLSLKPTFSLSTFTFIKRLFSFSSLSAIRMVSSAYNPYEIHPCCSMYFILQICHSLVYSFNNHWTVRLSSFRATINNNVMNIHVLVLVHVCSFVPDTLRPHALQFVKLPCLWNFPGQNSGVGCYFLLQYKSLCVHKFASLIGQIQKVRF